MQRGFRAMFRHSATWRGVDGLKRYARFVLCKYFRAQDNVMQILMKYFDSGMRGFVLNLLSNSDSINYRYGYSFNGHINIPFDR